MGRDVNQKEEARLRLALSWFWQSIQNSFLKMPMTFKAHSLTTYSDMYIGQNEI